MNYNIRQIREPTGRGRNLATNSKKYSIIGKTRDRVAKPEPERRIQSDSAARATGTKQDHEKFIGLRGSILGSTSTSIST